MSCAKADSLTSGKTVVVADPCKDNTFAKVEAQLDNFFDDVTAVGNTVLNIDHELKKVVNTVKDTLSGMINGIIGNLSDELSELIPKAIKALEKFLLGLGRTIPEIIAIETPLIPLVGALFDGLFCLSKKVINAAADILTDLLTGAVKNVLNAGACVTAQVLGAFTNKITNIIDSVVSPLLGPIKDIIGQFFDFDVKGHILSGIGILRKVQNLFECDDEKICPASSKIKIDQGIVKDSGEDEQLGLFDAVFKGASGANNALSAGADNLASDFEKEYGKWSIFGKPLSESSSLGPCNFGNRTDCGGPKVEFFGGGGIGASGTAILGKIVDEVDTENLIGDLGKVGSIVGVNIENPGKSYISEPFVTFTDDCNKGYGAYGRAIIGRNPNSPQYGQIIAVVMTSEGENYPANIDEDILYVDDVIIENPGEGYDDEDTMDNFDIVVEDGRIISAKPKSGLGFNGLPDLNINSNTGFGAVLRPIMNFVPPQTEVIQVIDCVRS